MSLRHWKAFDERPNVSIKYHHETGGFYFSLLIVLLTVHTVSLTFLTTLLAPNIKDWARGGGKRGGEVSGRGGVTGTGATKTQAGRSLCPGVA